MDANGNLTGYILYELFESSANGVSFGHYNTSLPNDYKFVAMSERSFGVDDPVTVEEFRQGTGKANPFPKTGPVVINEIMFAPSNTIYVSTNGLTVTNQNPAEEFIELRNIASTNVLLYDPLFLTNRWRLQSAVTFAFPVTNLAPNQFALVVGFDPYTNLTALNNFRSRYGVSNSVPIFGPWAGRLSDTGDSIELYRPDPPQDSSHPDYGFVPYIRTDKVNYSANVPWPTGAITNGFGTGLSLQRKNSERFGNDPINWAVAGPNAGFVSAELQDTDGDGIPDRWETDHGLLPNDASDAALDPDQDGFTNLQEYIAGTDPHVASSALRVVEVIPFVGTNLPAIVRFLAYSNTTYTVQYRNSLLPSSQWQKLEDIAAAPTNRLVEAPDANAYKKSDRYYRVVAPATN